MTWPSIWSDNVPLRWWWLWCATLSGTSLKIMTLKSEWMDGWTPPSVILSCEKGGIWSVLRSDWEWKMRVLFDGSGNGNENFPRGIILIPLVKYLTFWFRRQVNYLYELIGIIQINFSSENFTGQWKLWTIHSTYFISLCFVKKKCTILAVLQI